MVPPVAPTMGDVYVNGSDDVSPNRDGVPFPLSSDTNTNTDASGGIGAIPNWIGWLILGSIFGLLIIGLVALLIKYLSLKHKSKTANISRRKRKKRKLKHKGWHSVPYQPYDRHTRPNRRSHHRNSGDRSDGRFHRDRRSGNNFLPRLERPPRAFNQNHFRSFHGMPPVSSVGGGNAPGLPHYTGTRNSFYEELRPPSSDSNRRHRRNRRERRGSSDSLRRQLLPASEVGSGSSLGEPELDLFRPRPAGESSVNHGLVPRTGIPVPGRARGGGENYNEGRGLHQGSNHTNQDHARDRRRPGDGHAHYENHWGANRHYQNQGPPPYPSRSGFHYRYGSARTIDDFLAQYRSDLV